MDRHTKSLILEQIPVLVLNPDNTIKHWNIGLSKLYGWTQSEVLGEDAHQLLKTVFPQSLDHIERQYKETGDWEGELIQKKKDDSQIVVASHWFLQREKQGQVIAKLEFNQDITRCKRVEEKLREAERFTQATIDALPAHICVLDEYGTIISTNLAWREFADANGGADPQYNCGDNYLEVCDKALGIDSEGASAFAEGIRKVMRREIDQFSLEYTCDSPWENRWFIARGERFKGEEWDRLVIMHVNITARKQSELRLSLLTKRYQDLFENSGTNIMIVDENGKFILVNRKAAAVLGKLPEEVVGKSMFDFLSVESAAKYLEFNRQLIETGGHREYEDTFKLPDGERAFLIVDQAIQDENHRNFAIQSSSIDITGRNNAEEGLRKSRERLSRLSYHLVETQEQERRRIARELHDEIGQTLTALTIALNGISQADKSFNHKLDNLKGLTHDLIDQVNSLSSELRPRVLDDLGLVPGLISLFNRFTAQAGIEIDFKHGLIKQKQIPPEIEITAYRIIQESLTNVVRHSDVKLAIVRIQIDEDTLWIQIQDAGKGFDYQTALNSSSSMGLMSMLERAELVGGLFSIQTAPGEGANITCRLPLGDRPIERRKYGRG